MSQEPTHPTMELRTITPESVFKAIIAEIRDARVKTIIGWGDTTMSWEKKLENIRERYLSPEILRALGPNVAQLLGMFLCSNPSDLESLQEITGVTIDQAIANVDDTVVALATVSSALAIAWSIPC